MEAEDLASVDAHALASAFFFFLSHLKFGFLATLLTPAYNNAWNAAGTSSSTSADNSDSNSSRATMGKGIVNSRNVLRNGSFTGRTGPTISSGLRGEAATTAPGLVVKGGGGRLLVAPLAAAAGFAATTAVAPFEED